jgi:imidazole glycerol-phosphate synthase subunit HisH
MSAPIAVIDTGICNLRSVTKALEAVGASPWSCDARGVDASGAEGLVLPGVGALRDCVGSLRASGLDATVREWIASDRPFLGVCLGMQALFDESEEGGVKGLGSSRPGGALQAAAAPSRCRTWAGTRSGSRTGRELALLARAWRPRGSPSISSTATTASRPIRSLVLAECDYGAPLSRRSAAGGSLPPSSIPKKSQAKGLRIYRNFGCGSFSPLIR